MSWSGQRERGSPWATRAALAMALHGGRAAAPLLAWPATIWFLATAGQARLASRDYLRRVLGRPATLPDIARHFHAFARAVLDRVLLLSGHGTGFRIETHGLDRVLAILAQGRGCILLGAHLGSFEVLRTVAAQAPVPVWALMYRRNGGALTALLDRLAPDLRDQVLEIGDTASMIRARECIERGEMVGILADRAPPGHRMVPVPFLGGTAPFPSGPFVLAGMLGAPVVLFHAVRTGPRRYAVGFEPFADPVTLRRTHRAADLHDVVARYAAALERLCRAHPMQWFNFFPFWDDPGRTTALQAPTRRPLLLAALPLLAAWPGRLAAEAAPSLDALMARLAAVPARQASFIETKRFAALDGVLESRGTLSYRRGRVEKVTTWPVPERLEMDADRLVLTTGNEPPRVIDAAMAPELRVLIDAVRGPLVGDAAALRRAFEAEMTGTMAAWTLVLTPRDAAGRRMLRLVRLEGREDQVDRLAITQANGDEQVMAILPR